MRNKKLITALLFFSFLVAGAIAQAKNENSATRVEELIWANGKIYDTVVSGSTFKSPPAHSVDLFFNFGMSGLTGQRPVSDAAPGDKEYNGGRWWVQLVIFTDQGKAALGAGGAIISELTSADEILDQEAMGNLTIMPTNNYFSCPLVGKGK